MISKDRYEPTSTAETILSISIFLLAVLILGRILLRIIIKSYLGALLGPVLVRYLKRCVWVYSCAPPHHHKKTRDDGDKVG